MSAEAERGSAALRAYTEAAEAPLRALLEERAARWSPLPLGTPDYLRHLAEYVLRGGKRFRGALVTLGYEACGGEGGRGAERIVRASLSFELVHAGLLILDDVMDRDELRRGGPALHVLAREEARRQRSSDPEHLGLSVTMLSALLAQALGYDVLAAAGFAEPERARALAWLNEVFEGVVLGQVLDVCAAGRPAAPADLSLIQQLKTGLYTTEGPLRLGALLAGASPADLRAAALQSFARPLGKAFQLVDDVLAVEGAASETGKSSGDLREGRRTSVVEEAMVLARPEVRSRLAGLVGRPLGAEGAEEARRLVLSTGAAESIRRRAQAFAAEAQQALGTAPLPRSTVETLSDLAHLVVERRA